MKSITFVVLLAGAFSVSCSSSSVKTGRGDVGVGALTNAPNSAPRSLASNSASSSSSASSGASFDLDDSQHSILSHYFLSGDQQTRFLINRRFSTNADKEYLAERAQKALDEAFGKTFANLASAQGAGETTASLGALLGGIKSNLPDALVGNFVKTIRVYKLVNTRMQYDWIFEAEQIDANSFESELGSNDLTLLSRKGSLSAKLSAQDEREDVTRAMQFLQTQRGVPTKPVFSGGSISLAIEILRPWSDDSGADASKLFSATIRLRRYLFHRAGRVENSYSKDALKVAAVGFDKAMQGAAASTVDFIYSVNPKSPRPKLERIDIYPGKVLSTTPVGAKSMEMQTANYTLSGAWGKKPFQVAVERISLDGTTREAAAGQMSMKFVSGKGLFGLTEDFLFPEISSQGKEIFKDIVNEVVETGGSL